MKNETVKWKALLRVTNAKLKNKKVALRFTNSMVELLFFYVRVTNSNFIKY